MKYALSLGALVLAFAPITLFAEAPTTQPHDSAFYQSLAVRLGSDDASVRDTAQKDLDALSIKDQEDLVTLSHHAPTEEARIQLVARLQKFAEQYPTQPPLLSLDVDNASWAEVADLLSDAMGQRITPAPPSNRTPTAPTFTLHVNHVPFWDLYRDLSHQTPLVFEESSGQGLNVHPNAANGATSFVTVGAFAVFPQSISSSLDLQRFPTGGPPSKRRVQLAFNIAADPRVRIVALEKVGLTHVVDDAGNVLLDDTAKPPTFDLGNSHTWLFFSNLNIPDNVGKTISSARGTAVFTVQTTTATAELLSGARPSAPFICGDCRISIQIFHESAGSCTLMYSAEKLDARGRRVQLRMNPSLGFASVVDQAGKEVWAAPLQRNGNANIRGPFAGDLKLRVSVPSESIEVPVDFELKDIPLP